MMNNLLFQWNQRDREWGYSSGTRYIFSFQFSENDLIIKTYLGEYKNEE